MLLEGEAGIGKSALLRTAEWEASERGFWVLRCAGLESASPTGYAALGDLLRPLLPYAAGLAPRQRRALLTAVGLEEGPAPEQILVALGALGLLEDAASRQPVFASVEDAHWLDPSSAQVIAFVAPRLADSRVVLAAAARTPRGSGPDLGPSWQQLTVEPLGREPAALLLETIAGEMTPALRDRILAEAAGNPLALQEFPAAIRSLGADRPGPLPITEKLQRAYLHQLTPLPAASRTLLLLAATGEDLRLPDLLAAAGTLGLGIGDLDPLEAARLLTVSETRLRFRHPLLRTAVRAAASQAQLSQAHRALAAVVTDPVRAAWHRAGASPGPDEAVAADLEATGRQARARGALPEAATLLERSAQSSPAAADRARRFALAAENARQAGLVPAARSLLTRAQHLLEDDPDAVADSAVVTDLALTRLMMGLSAPDQLLHNGPDLLALSRRLTAPQDVHRRVRLLFCAALAARLQGLGPARWREVETELAGIDTDDPLKTVALTFLAPLGEQPHRRRELPALVGEYRDFPLGLLGLGLAAMAVQDLETALVCWNLCVEKYREGGAVADEAMALRARARITLLQGQLREALTDAEESRRIAEERRPSVRSSETYGVLALIHALLGDDEAAAEAVRRARTPGGAAPSILSGVDASWAAGIRAARRGDHESAFTELSAAGMRPEEFLWSIADLTESAVRIGRTEEARRAVDRAARVAEAYPSAHLRMLVARSRALLAVADGAADVEQHFAEALAAGEASRSPLELARTRLLRGEWLRQDRRREEARADLAAAQAGFRSLGAVPLAERATAALRATGLAGAPSDEPVEVRLSAQELQVARLAAEGLSNKEIADRIYLSPRTVAGHLYRIYPKIGVAKRSQLHQALIQAGYQVP